MVNVPVENLVICVPGLDENCDIPPQEQEVEPASGWNRGDTAVLLHGIVAVANVAVPITLRFMVVEY